MKKLFTALFLLLVYMLPAQDFVAEQFKGIKARNIGPAGMSGRITAIDVDLSNQDRIFVGSASGGVWLSENGGISWKPIFDKQNVLSIGAIKINQQNPAEIWVGTGEGNPRNSQNSGAGVFKSLDGGKTWTFKGLKESRVIHRIIIDETKPGTVYIGAQGAQWGTSESRGVFKTTNGGDTWDKVLYVNEGVGIADLVVDPTNPNKLIAAMWEFGRTPAFFNSGGPGSGLYITYDGGDNWKKLSTEEGMPKGDLGRMGLAFAPSNPKIVYALIEAKKNALYKSYDGGATWKEHSTHENIGNRPFYYYDLFVDPKDDNRVYSLYTYVSRSRDGGKSFDIIADYGNNVHPDHHAFWISPDDPSYLIDGNDGGLNISHDGGDTWRFVTNLPVGQFYHVDVDDDFPYNVYGGMQDNGSWVGPAFTLKRGGITNADWQEVYFGDGFDSAPKPNDNRYVYAMSQGGNLGLVDRETGVNRFIKPNNPDTTDLRFNWNAAFALKPNTDCSLYYGSQFVHYSEDCGESWSIISPDLTTNDTSKQHQDISGGLTIDATNAENNTCILAIAPSPVDDQVIWVGTDDGNLQITKNGGETWSNVISRMPSLPKTAWIPQIEVSTTNAGEAFVVVNNYRQNDWSAYLYHTADYGVTWRRLVDDKDVTSFVTSVVQDTKEPNLLFLGTDAGLYVSFNKGGKWHKWNNGFPSVQIRDMKIQPTFDDLVLGTFGRAFWVIDDIGPLRAYAKENYGNKDFALVSSTDGYLSNFRSYQGIRFIGQAEFVGENKGTGVQLNLWVKPEDEKKKNSVAKEMSKVVKKGKSRKGKKGNKSKAKMDATDKGAKDKVKTDKKKKEKVKCFVVDAKGDTIRTFSRKIKEKGLVRIGWDMRTDGVRMPSRREAKPDEDLPRGLNAIPGKYTIIAQYGDHTDKAEVEVKLDPRVEDITAQDIQDLTVAFEQLNGQISEATSTFDKLKEAKKRIEIVDKLAETLADSLKVDLKKISKEQKEQIDDLMLLYMDKPDQKGIQRNPKTLSAMIRGARRYLASSYGKPTPNAQVAIDKAEAALADARTKIDAYFSEDWPAYQKEVEALTFYLFNLD